MINLEFEQVVSLFINYGPSYVGCLSIQLLRTMRPAKEPCTGSIGMIKGIWNGTTMWTAIISTATALDFLAMLVVVLLFAPWLLTNDIEVVKHISIRKTSTCASWTLSTRLLLLGRLSRNQSFFSFFDQFISVSMGSIMMHLILHSIYSTVDPSHHFFQSMVLLFSLLRFFSQFSFSPLPAGVCGDFEHHVLVLTILRVAVYWGVGWTSARLEMEWDLGSFFGPKKIEANLLIIHEKHYLFISELAAPMIPYILNCSL